MLCTDKLNPVMHYRRLEPFGLLLEAEQPGSELPEVSVDMLRRLILHHRLVVLRGFAGLDRDGLERYCATWGKLLTWNFGTVLDVVVHDDPKNYVFTNGSVPYHWDGAFAPIVPSLQVFQCLQAPSPGSGGETLFADTARIWEEATPEQRERWSGITIDYCTEKVAHYGGRITAPLVAHHPVTGQTVLRFAEPGDRDTAELNPLELQGRDLAPEQLATLLQEMRSLLHDPRYCHAHAWQPGDFLIADNHALLHARRAFRAHSPRHIQRVHII